MMGDSESADVVIVGGGLAGLAAGICCAAAGQRVTVLEQGIEERYLCNSRITMGVFQIALHDMASGPQALRAAIDHATHSYVDPLLADSFAGEAGASIQWLQAQGIRFDSRWRGCRQSGGAIAAGPEATRLALAGASRRRDASAAEH